MIDEKNIQNEEAEEEEEYDTIILTDENGKETEFEYLDLIEYEGKEYIVLLPMEGAADEDQVYVLEYEEVDEENCNFKSVATEKILNSVFEIFKERHQDEFNFI